MKCKYLDVIVIFYIILDHLGLQLHLVLIETDCFKTAQQILSINPVESAIQREDLIRRLIIAVRTRTSDAPKPRYRVRINSVANDRPNERLQRVIADTVVQNRRDAHAQAILFYIKRV